MRICIIGDQHFRLQLPYANALSDGRVSEWEAVIRTIHETAKSCDAVVLLGDNLNTRHNHSSVNRQFVDFLKGFDDKIIYVIAGNHGRFGKETAIDFLRNLRIPKWHIYTDVPEVPSFFNDSNRFAFLPYMTPGVLGVESLEEAQKKILELLPEADILFHHHAVSGTEISGTTSEHLNEVVLPREELEKRYKWVIGGHIHSRQWLSDKTLVTGNIFTQEVGEHSKSIFVLDTDSNVIDEVHLPVRGIYQVFLTRSPKDREIIDIPDNSIVRCIVTDRQLDIENIKKNTLSRFDASIVIEQYPNSRQRIAIDDRNGLDLSVSNLLKVYSEARDVSYNDLMEAMSLLNES